MKKEINIREEAKQEAIKWQTKISNCDISYEELFVKQDYFIELAEKFDLTEEFKENGII
jgi:hypothetical protein